MRFARDRFVFGEMCRRIRAAVLFVWGAVDLFGSARSVCDLICRRPCDLWPFGGVVLRGGAFRRGASHFDVDIVPDNVIEINDF